METVTLRFGEKECILEKKRFENLLHPITEENKIIIDFHFDSLNGCPRVTIHLSSGSKLILRGKHLTTFLSFAMENENYLCKFIEVIRTEEIRIYLFFILGCIEQVRHTPPCSPSVLKMDGRYIVRPESLIIRETNLSIAVEEIESSRGISSSRNGFEIPLEKILLVDATLMAVYTPFNFFKGVRKIREYILSIEGFRRERISILNSLETLSQTQEIEPLSLLLLRAVVFEHSLMLYRRLVQC